MLLVHDLAVRVVADRRDAELVADLAFQGSDELVGDSLVAEHIVGRHARLPAVQELAPDDASRRQIDLGGLVDDAGALPAELEHDRRQVRSRLLEHDLSDRLAAGEEDEVELLVEQLLVLLAPTAHARDVVLGEDIGDEVIDHLARRRRIRARLHDGGVARRERIDQRLDSQQERIVPWADDQHVAQRRRQLVTARHVMRERRAHMAPTREPAHVLEHVRDLAEHQPDFAHIAFRRAFAQIGRERIVDFLLMEKNAIVQRAQRGLTRLERYRRPAAKHRPLPFYQFLNMFTHRFSFLV